MMTEKECYEYFNYLLIAHSHFKTAKLHNFIHITRGERKTSFVLLTAKGS